MLKALGRLASDATKNQHHPARQELAPGGAQGTWGHQEPEAAKPRGTRKPRPQAEAPRGFPPKGDATKNTLAREHALGGAP